MNIYIYKSDFETKQIRIDNIDSFEGIVFFDLDSIEPGCFVDNFNSFAYDWFFSLKELTPDELDKVHKEFRDIL